MINTKDLEFQKYCKHCKYMKRYKGYTHELFNSRYFDKNAELTLPQILVKYNIPISQQTVYSCLKKHFPQFNAKIAPLLAQTLTNTVNLIEGSDSSKPHEQVLDEFIQRGRSMIKSGELVVTAPTLIQAINTKANIEKSQKDRKLEMIKAFFAGKESDETNTTRQPTIEEG